jgi:hypothetical protein
MDQLLSLGDVSGAAKNSEGVSRDQLPEKKGIAEFAFRHFRDCAVPTFGRICRAPKVRLADFSGPTRWRMFCQLPE